MVNAVRAAVGARFEIGGTWRDGGRGSYAVFDTSRASAFKPTATPGARQQHDRFDRGDGGWSRELWRIVGGGKHSLGVQEQRRKCGPPHRTIVLRVVDRSRCGFGCTATLLDRRAGKSSELRWERNGVGTDGRSDFDEGFES